MRATAQVYSGHAATEFNRAVLSAYGTICHLCGHPGATTADHLIPRSQRPDLAFDLANARPAHHACNSRRQDNPLQATYVGEGW